MANLENPTLEFLIYLIQCCVRQCEIDPDKTTITELIKKIQDAEIPIVF